MSLTLVKFNNLGLVEANRELISCCGSSQWAKKMAQARPFESFTDVYEEAEQVWTKLSREDWLEAFGHHPRIGEKNLHAKWAQEEQKGVEGAPEDLLRDIIKGNQEYEAKFGHVFLICATGKSAQEMLEALRERMKSNAEAELRTAAHEQAKITRIRLEKLFKK